MVRRMVLHGCDHCGCAFATGATMSCLNRRAVPTSDTSTVYVPRCDRRAALKFRPTRSRLRDRPVKHAFCRKLPPCWINDPKRHHNSGRSLMAAMKTNPTNAHTFHSGHWTVLASVLTFWRYSGHFLMRSGANYQIICVYFSVLNGNHELRHTTFDV
jgi:hypothetical protein